MADRQRVLGELLGWLSGEGRQPSDWKALVGLACDTLTVGSLADAVLSSGDRVDVPADVAALLGDVRERARRRNALLRIQFLEALPKLNSAGVEPIPMRGLALLLDSEAEEARLLSDIDLLIPAERAHDCLRALAELGYQLVKGDPDGPLPLVLGRSSDVGTIDLHIMLQPLYMQLDYHRTAPDCRPAQLDAGRLLRPSPTCQMMFIVVHDQLHDADYWRGLIDVRHLVDMARLVAEGVDWDRLEAFFPAGSPRNALDVQLRSARKLLNLPIPLRHCGGAWAELHLARRRFQARHPGTMGLLTLLSMAADRPLRVRSGSPLQLASGPLWRRVQRRVPGFLRAASSGKFPLPG
jgi:hypothetical protein